MKQITISEQTNELFQCLTKLSELTETIDNNVLAFFGGYETDCYKEISTKLYATSADLRLLILDIVKERIYENSLAIDFDKI